MEEKHRAILRQLQDIIVRDVKVDDIIDSLISKGVISDEAYEQIKLEKDQRSKTRKLLEIIIGRGPHAYGHFKNALQIPYDWIFDQMENLENSEDRIDAMDAPLRQTPPPPDLPPMSSLTVTRIDKVEQLRAILRNLKPKNYAVVHALKGFGKSTLASTTLQDNTLVRELFDNEYYWMKFGYYQSSRKDILGQLNMLYHQVLNLESFTEPTSEKALKYPLKRHFAQHPKALLILEDVTHRDVIDTFDFGCKTLVLTQDLDLLEGKQYEFVELNDGFTLNESLELFAKALGNNNLPEEAGKIHDACKGMPLMIAMLASQFKEFRESMLHSNKRWLDYLEDLTQKDSKVLQKSLQKQARTFDLCIDALPDDLVEYYNSLSIFVEDVHITPKTLQILWNVTEFKADNIMLQLRNKSLVVRQWHVGLGMYIYGVHDLLLSHLRVRLTPENVQEKHKRFVLDNLSRTETGGDAESNKRDFSKLPKDNYIHSYIGHHMEEAGLYDEFPEVFFNFSFIEAKVYHVGTGDLLIDLKKYRKYITKNYEPEFVEKLEDLEQFLIQQAQTLAEYSHRNCLDLVQIALKYPHSGYVRDTAMRLARERGDRLYIDHAKHNIPLVKSLSDELHSPVSCVAFTNNQDMILVGNDRGETYLWNCNHRHQVAFYENNTDYPIKKIVVANDGSYFLTISQDGKVRVFALTNDLQKLDGGKKKPVHPKLKLDNGNNMFNQQSNRHKSCATLFLKNQTIMDVTICKSGNEIAACTNMGYLVVWDRNGYILRGPYEACKGGMLSNIVFTSCDTQLNAINAVNGSLTTYNASDLTYKTQYSSGANSDILALLSIPHYTNVLIIVTKKNLIVVTWMVMEGDIHTPKKSILAEINDDKIAYTCATLTRDGRYLVVGDAGGFVTVFDYHNQGRILKSYSRMVTTLDTYWSDDKSHFICGGNNDTLLPMVHRWRFDPKEKIGVQKSPIFDVIVEPDDENIIAVGTSLCTVQILQNDKVLAETPIANGTIKTLLVSENGHRILYGTNAGSINIFHYKEKRVELAFEVRSPVEFLDLLTIDDKTVIVCKDGDQNLRVWTSDEDKCLLSDNEPVISCHLLKKIRRVMTVARDKIKFWDYKDWRLQNSIILDDIVNRTHCCLSQSQSIIAIATASRQVRISRCESSEILGTFEMTTFYVRDCKDIVFSLSISHDDKFVAIGFATGNISIFNLESKTEVHMLQLHLNPVTQLYWAPSSVKKDILLSLANELAWWDISWLNTWKSMTPYSKFTENQENQKNLDSNYNSNSDSHNMAIDSLPGNRSETTEANANEENDLPSIWKVKSPNKYPKIPGLLNLVKLDGNHARKVWCSQNFTDFITVDGEGKIYNLHVQEPNCP